MDLRQNDKYPNGVRGSSQISLSVPNIKMYFHSQIKDVASRTVAASPEIPETPRTRGQMEQNIALLWMCGHAHLHSYK